MLPDSPYIGALLGRREGLRRIELEGEDVHCEDYFSHIHECLERVECLSFIEDEQFMHPGPQKNLEGPYAWLATDKSQAFGVKILAATRRNNAPFRRYMYSSILTSAEHNLKAVEVTTDHVFNINLLPVFLGGVKVALHPVYARTSYANMPDKEFDSIVEKTQCSIKAVNMLRERFADCKSAKKISKIAEEIYKSSESKAEHDYAKHFAFNADRLNGNILKARKFLRERKCGI